MTTYKGFDVLELDPNWKEGVQTEHSRGRIVLDPGFGKIHVEDKQGKPRLTNAFSWFMESRAAVVAFKDFVEARKGAAVPFWFPTWRRDFQLDSSMANTDTSGSFVNVGFTKFQYANAARRNVAFLLPDGTKIYRKITVATEASDTVETLNFDSSTGVAIPKETLIASLLLVRLAQDQVTVRWHSSTVAEAELSLIEVPSEVPA